jgi:hypothetical protein
MNIALVKKAKAAQDDWEKANDWEKAMTATANFHKQQKPKARQQPSAEYLETWLTLLQA